MKKIWEAIKRFFGWKPKVVKTPVNNFTEWTTFEKSIAAAINMLREQHAQSTGRVTKVRQLIPEKLLWEEARKRCQYMIDTQEVSHEGVGVAFKAIIDAGFQSPGEILAYAYSTPSSVVNAWNNSEGHRKAMLSYVPHYFGVAMIEHNTKKYYCVLFCR